MILYFRQNFNFFLKTRIPKTVLVKPPSTARRWSLLRRRVFGRRPMGPRTRIPCRVAPQGAFRVDADHLVQAGEEG
jgi:hypothetical protein